MASQHIVIRLLLTISAAFLLRLLHNLVDISAVVKITQLARPEERYVYTAIPTTNHNHTIGKTRRFHINGQVRCVAAHPIYQLLSRSGLLDPIQLAYDPRCRKASS